MCDSYKSYSIFYISNNDYIEKVGYNKDNNTMKFWYYDGTKKDYQINQLETPEDIIKALENNLNI